MVKKLSLLELAQGQTQQTIDAGAQGGQGLESVVPDLNLPYLQYVSGLSDVLKRNSDKYDKDARQYTFRINGLRADEGLQVNLDEFAIVQFIAVKKLIQYSEHDPKGTTEMDKWRIVEVEAAPKIRPNFESTEIDGKAVWGRWTVSNSRQVFQRAQTIWQAIGKVLTVDADGEAAWVTAKMYFDKVRERQFSDFLASLKATNGEAALFSHIYKIDCEQVTDKKSGLTSNHYAFSAIGPASTELVEQALEAYDKSTEMLNSLVTSGGGQTYAALPGGQPASQQTIEVTPSVPSIPAEMRLT